jgi:hypothetical protein
MKLNELKTLRDLILKLQEERLDKYRDEGYDIDSMDDYEIQELDDGDNLIQGIDIVFTVVSEQIAIKEVRGEK